MSNLDQKIENAANKIEVVANEAWKKTVIPLSI